MARKIDLLPRIPTQGGWEQVSLHVEETRHAIASQIGDRIEGDAGGLAIALAVGKRDYLAQSVQEALRHSGLAHILAISGLHMALVAMSIFWGVRAVLALVPHLALSYPIKQWAAFIALICATGYLLLSGSSVATIRAFAMTSIFLVAIIVGRPALTLHNLALALLLVVLLQPFAVVEAGMQMSFAATAALIASYDRLRDLRLRWGVKKERGPDYDAEGQRRFADLPGVEWALTAMRWIAGIGMTSIIAGVAVLPFSIVHFQQMAPLGLVANLMVMPVVTLVVMPFGLLSVALVPLGLQSLFLPVVEWGLGLVIASAQWVANQSDERLLVVSGQGVILGFFVLALAIYAIHRQKLAWLCLAPIAVAGLVWLQHAPPDLWISKNGTKVAFRGQDQRWHLLGSKRVTLDYSAILHFDGDVRVLEAARKQRQPDDQTNLKPFRGCDRAACFADGLFKQSGEETDLSVSLVRRASAFNEACRKHAIIVSKLTIPQDCIGPLLLIGPEKLQTNGARFIRFHPDPERANAMQRGDEHKTRLEGSELLDRLVSRWVIAEQTALIAGRRPWQ